VRAFGDGFVSILVPVYLTGIGFGAFEVGVLTTAMLLDPAMMTLGVGLIAHRLKTVRLLATATALMVLSGIGYAFETEFWPLLIIALVGTLSPTASDVSVFAPLEQTLLSNAVVPQKRTRIFATYSLIGSVLSAIGCLFASAPEIVARASLMPPNRALQGMFLVYAFLGAIAFMIYRQMKSPAEAPVSEPANGPLGPSRRVVFTLAALFSLDSFGGGFFVQSLLALWLFEYFGLSLTAAGSLFFWSGLLSAFSYPVAVRLARRIGLVNTMVFTHLPSNVCLMLVPFAPTLRNCNNAAADKEHSFSDGCAGKDIICDGCRHSSRAPSGSKYHSGAAEPCRSGKSSPCGLFARAFKLRVAACDRRRPQQPLRPAALVHVSQGPTARRANLRRCAQ
jgi:MFS family permease